MMDPKPNMMMMGPNMVMMGPPGMMMMDPPMMMMDPNMMMMDPNMMGDPAMMGRIYHPMMMNNEGSWGEGGLDSSWGEGDHCWGEGGLDSFYGVRTSTKRKSPNKITAAKRSLPLLERAIGA